jgi:hypothetical protein
MSGLSLLGIARLMAYDRGPAMIEPDSATAGVSRRVSPPTAAEPSARLSCAANVLASIQSLLAWQALPRKLGQARRAQSWSWG